MEYKNFNLAKDGIEGFEIEVSEVYGGNRYRQYALGRVERGGKINLYCRSEKERNTYGGWRWEGYPRRVVNYQDLLGKFKEE